MSKQEIITALTNASHINFTSLWKNIPNINYHITYMIKRLSANKEIF